MDLTNLVLEAQRRSKLTKELTDTLDLAVYNYIRGKFSYDEDYAAEFLLAVRDTIHQCVFRFQYYGLQFEAYLNRTLDYHSVRFIKNKYVKKNLEDCCYNMLWLDSIYKKSVTSEADERDVQGELNSIIIGFLQEYIYKFSHSRYLKATAHKFLLIWLLKMSYFVHLDRISQYAKLIGYPEEYLEDKLIQANTLLEKRVKKYQAIQYKIQEISIALLSNKICLTALQQDSLLHLNLARTIKYQENRLQSLKNRLLSINIYLKNIEIANLLNIKKGTVDSAIFRLQSNFKNLISELYLKDRDRDSLTGKQQPTQAQRITPANAQYRDQASKRLPSSLYLLGDREDIFGKFIAESRKAIQYTKDASSS